MAEPQPERNHGWTVTLAGMGINLALGVLYSWSVLKKAIPVEWGWDDADKALPYSVACMIFALTMIPEGFINSCGTATELGQGTRSFSESVFASWSRNFSFFTFCSASAICNRLNWRS